MPTKMLATVHLLVRWFFGIVFTAEVFFFAGLVFVVFPAQALGMYNHAYHTGSFQITILTTCLAAAFWIVNFNLFRLQPVIAKN